MHRGSRGRPLDAWFWEWIGTGTIVGLFSGGFANEAEGRGVVSRVSAIDVVNPPSASELCLLIRHSWMHVPYTRVCCSNVADKTAPFSYLAVSLFTC